MTLRMLNRKAFRLCLLLILIFLNLTVSLSWPCLSHLAEGCKRPEYAGFCQMKWTQEKLNVTRLFPCLPVPPLCPPRCDPSSSFLAKRLDTHPLFLFILIVILGHLQIYFSVSASLFCVSVFSLSHMQRRNHQTARKGGGNMRCLPHILPRRPLCWRRPTRSVCLHVCHVRVSMFACVWACVSVCVPVGKWTSLASKPVCSQSEVVSTGHSCSPPLLILPSQASRLRW